VGVYAESSCLETLRQSKNPGLLVPGLNLNTKKGVFHKLGYFKNKNLRGQKQKESF
jgi:hypothetical protein